MDSIPLLTRDEWNLDSPKSLFLPGILQGQSINLDNSKTVLKGTSGRIFIRKICDNVTIQLNDGEEGLVAVKIVEDNRQCVPRNLRREAKLLSQMNHPNVLPLLNAYLIDSVAISPIPSFYFFTPLYPLTLSDLLQALSFTSELDSFEFMTHSLTWQMLSAVSYIHSQGIAHRDIGPGNFVIARNGRIILIDFGIAIEQGDEEDGSMHFEIGTGPYRAPELLFASKSYDVFALDLWSLGATIAEFFTSFSNPTLPSPTSSRASSTASSINSDGRWEDQNFDSTEGAGSPIVQRMTLFDNKFGDIALIGSIYKIRGTPTIESWPEAAGFKNFKLFNFFHQDPIPLVSLLPHLSPSSPILNILERLLSISAKSRMNAEEGKNYVGWRDVVILKPEEKELGSLIEQFIS